MKKLSASGTKKQSENFGHIGRVFFFVHSFRYNDNWTSEKHDDMTTGQRNNGTFYNSLIIQSVKYLVTRNTLNEFGSWKWAQNIWVFHSKSIFGTNNRKSDRTFEFIRTMGGKFVDISFFLFSVVGSSSLLLVWMNWKRKKKQLSSAWIFPHMDNKVKISFHNNDSPRKWMDSQHFKPKSRNIVLFAYIIIFMGCVPFPNFKYFASKSKSFSSILFPTLRLRENENQKT